MSTRNRGGTGRAERERKQLRDVSDALLRRMNELKDLEKRKRLLEISTPEFHEAADAVAEKSREIFALAHDEQAVGNRIDERQDVATEDVDPTSRRGR